MIDIVFTLDYEIYGNGARSLEALVYKPAHKLAAAFRRQDAAFVAFVEALEFEQIERNSSDSAIGLVKDQVKELHDTGFEIGLHLHPQWANASYKDGSWQLDSSEYNLCTLTRKRIVEIVDRSIAYLRYLVDDPKFVPLSFRAGNWLFQPSREAARVLAERGLRIDSSVFKGGLQRSHGLDYRRTLKYGPYWRFGEDVTQPDLRGSWIEVPIHSEMVFPLRMARPRRLGFGNAVGLTNGSASRKVYRMLDFLRFQCPLKLDFCRLTLQELVSMMTKIIRQDREDPSGYRPIVAIGHTKDLIDPDTVEGFLSFLKANHVNICTFNNVFAALSGVTAMA